MSRAPGTGGIAVTPVAFRDPPLLNAAGVHEPYAWRAIVEATTDAGPAGLGETYADENHRNRLAAEARTITGRDAHALGAVRAG
jgi:glucarate dehydratase